MKATADARKYVADLESEFVSWESVCDACAEENK
jgi:hypothetical protein